MEQNKQETSSPELFSELVDIVAHLRSKEGCEWDREQTFESMKPHLLEEANEVIEAIENKNHENLAEELGDLLLHVVFLSQIAGEKDKFTISNVLKQINSKLKRRHPHVFGDVEVEGPEEIIANWEKIKQEEKQ